MPEGEVEMGHRGPTHPRRGPPLGRAYRGCGPPGPPLVPPSRLYCLLETLIHEGYHRKISPPLRGGKHRERKSSPADRFLPGKFLPEEGISSPSTPSSS